jgi:uncharacterized damage-inducible protein DinB
MHELENYRYRGARALVVLHERHLRSFLQAWRGAKAAGLTLPQTDHRAYRSLETLLGHVLAAARGYMVWTCKQLELPDPSIEPIPEDDELEAKADAYVEHLLARWREPLRDIEEERFYAPAYTSNWGPPYCLDAMLEHAVMHPIRHQFQLAELLAKKERA